jgi:hypothetical protein
MKATVVRYQAKPERADENQTLVEKVFADLEARQPDGFTYKVFRLEDGVSFIHVVIEHEVESPAHYSPSRPFRRSWRASWSVAISRQFRWEQPSSAAIGEHAWLWHVTPTRRRLIRGIEPLTPTLPGGEACDQAEHDPRRAVEGQLWALFGVRLSSWLSSDL